jgi:hypothetical protein
LRPEDGPRDKSDAKRQRQTFERLGREELRKLLLGRVLDEPQIQCPPAENDQPSDETACREIKFLSDPGLERRALSVDRLLPGDFGLFFSEINRGIRVRLPNRGIDRPRMGFVERDQVSVRPTASLAASMDRDSPVRQSSLVRSGSRR